MIRWVRSWSRVAILDACLSTLLRVLEFKRFINFLLPLSHILPRRPKLITRPPCPTERSSSYGYLVYLLSCGLQKFRPLKVTRLSTWQISQNFLKKSEKSSYRQAYFAPHPGASSSACPQFLLQWISPSSSYVYYMSCITSLPSVLSEGQWTLILRRKSASYDLTNMKLRP